MLRSRLFGCAALAIAGALGAATPAQANFCHLSWDVPCMPGPCGAGTAVVTLTICNTKQQVFDYQWTMKGPAGVIFMPPAGIVGLAPGECIDIPITVTCPPGLTSFIFSANITKFGPPPNEMFSCQGSIISTGPVKVTPVDPVIDVPADLARRIVVIVAPQPSPTMPAFFDIFVEVMGPFMVQPPMRRIMIPTGGMAIDSFFDVFVDLSPTDRGAPPPMGDAIFMVDSNGDGAPDMIVGSAGLRAQATACATDLNGDGVTDTADLGLLLDNFGQMCF